VRSGRALYVGISSYTAEQTREAAAILRDLGTPCLIHQPRYSMFDRRIEEGLLDALADEGIGCIVFSPLAQGLLTDKYLGGVPEASRASRQGQAAWEERLSGETLDKVRRLNEMAQGRGQSMAQLALAWLLRHPGMSSALIDASRPAQFEDAVGALDNLALSEEELAQIDTILGDAVRVA